MFYSLDFICYSLNSFKTFTSSWNPISDGRKVQRWLLFSLFFPPLSVLDCQSHSWVITEQFTLPTPANSASKLQKQPEQGPGVFQLADRGESIDWAVLSVMCECVSRRSCAPQAFSAIPERSIQSPQYASVDQLKGKSQSTTLIFKSPLKACWSLTSLFWQHCLFFQSCVSAESFPPALVLYRDAWYWLKSLLQEHFFDFWVASVLTCVKGLLMLQLADEGNGKLLKIKAVYRLRGNRAVRGIMLFYAARDK